MADAVSVQTVHTGTRRIIDHLTNDSDGTGESAVTKINVSDKTYPPFGSTVAATEVIVDRIEYSVWGFNHVKVYWDHDTDVDVALLFGQGVIDWTPEGGKKSSGTGGTGDVLVTTDGGAAGSGYDISIWYRPKA